MPKLASCKHSTNRMHTQCIFKHSGVFCLIKHPGSDLRHSPLLYFHHSANPTISSSNPRATHSERLPLFHRHQKCFNIQSKKELTQIGKQYFDMVNQNMCLKHSDLQFKIYYVLSLSKLQHTLYIVVFEVGVNKYVVAIINWCICSCLTYLYINSHCMSVFSVYFFYLFILFYFFFLSQKKI